MMPLTPRRRFGGPVLALTALLLPGVAAAQGGEARLAAGDRLELRIVGWAELDQIVPVDADGTAWFPVIGEVDVEGLTLREVRAGVAEAYSLTSVPAAPGDEGRSQLIQPSQVYVGVEAWRPVYVSGDLLAPRTVDYRPGLTLRQALVQAGGEAAGPEAAPVTREGIEALTLALARAQARVWGLKTLLGLDAPEDFDAIFATDTPGVQEVAELERARVEARGAQRDLARSALAESLQQARLRHATLLSMQAAEEEGRRLDEDLLAQVRDLAARGLATAVDVGDARQAVFQGASRALEIEGLIGELRVEIIRLEAEVEGLEIEERAALGDELGEALIAVQEIQAEIAALRAPGAATGPVGESLVAVVTRGGERLPPIDLASADLELQPGDLVEVLSGAGMPG